MRFFPFKRSLILFGWKSGAGQEHWDQSERRQSHSHQWTVKKPACCDGEKRQGARHAQGKDIQPHRHQLSENGNPVNCRQGADNVRKSSYGNCLCLSRSIFTQCVDDPHGELNAQEHEGPACSPQSPGLHAVILMFFGKHLLQETTQTPVR